MGRGHAVLVLPRMATLTLCPLPAPWIALPSRLLSRPGVMVGLGRVQREGALPPPGIDPPTLVIGLVSGGINTNVVPDNVKLRVDRRIIPEEDAQRVENELTDRIQGFAAKWPGIACRVKRILLARPFTPLAGQERLGEGLQRNAAQILGGKNAAHGVRP